MKDRVFSSGGRTSDRVDCWHRLVGLFFRLLYQELSWCYDLVAWLVSFGQWRAWGRTALSHLTGEMVLELGHGPGHLMLDLIEQGFQPVGLDLSPQMGRLAQRRLRHAKADSPLVSGYAEVLPFPNHTFDSVVATFPTAFIVNTATLSEVSRVLRPVGRLIVVLDARLTGRDPISRTIEWLYRITGQRGTGCGSDWETEFLHAGLVARVDHVQMKHSVVWILIAERTMPDDRD